jgi:hypothetical protein
MTPSRVQALDALAVTPRPLSAYRDMFMLSDDDLLAGPILDCPAGASPFGAQLRARGGAAISVDPAFRLPARELIAMARSDAARVADWQQANPGGFNWSYLDSPDVVRQRWTAALDDFAADIAAPDGRYVAAALPFSDRRFTTAVSGSLIFSYPQLLVTSGEVRVFPLHDTGGAPYAQLPELRRLLSRHGVATSLRSTGCSYSVAAGSDQMLALSVA